MNCKQGDLAYVFTTGGYPGLVGRIAGACIGIPRRLVRYGPATHPLCLTENVWHFDKPINVTVGEWDAEVSGAADEILRPIRDNPENHETEENETCLN